MYILENANAYPNASSSSRNAFARGAAPRYHMSVIIILKHIAKHKENFKTER